VVIRSGRSAGAMAWLATYAATISVVRARLSLGGRCRSSARCSSDGRAEEDARDRQSAPW
jgi:hypothetical protein